MDVLGLNLSRGKNIILCYHVQTSPEALNDRMTDELQMIWKEAVIPK
jgi:hypothetical protein